MVTSSYSTTCPSLRVLRPARSTADVARNKADGLRRHYGLADEAVAFWEHHADVDMRHADWAVSALGLMTEGQPETGVSVRRAANAWWGFLDEREAVGQAV